MRAPEFWSGDGGGVLPLLLSPLAALYAQATARRVAKPGWKAPVPVICCGNVTAGGAGKTTLALDLGRRLANRGINVHFLSRGYGGRLKGPLRVDPAKHDSHDVGDEALLLAAERPAWISGDRAAGARAAIEGGAQAIVMDDGLQNPTLQKTLALLVIDGTFGFGNGRVIPAGPLREPVERGARCDFRVVNGGEAGFGEWPMRLDADAAVPMRGGRPRPLADFAGRRVHAVAGIGDPERFFSMLRALGIAVVPHAFPDHHRYTAEELRFGNDLPVLMTEKDAVKCAAFADERCWSVPAQARLPEAFWIALLDKLPPRTM